MERRQTLIVVVTVLILLGTLVVSAYFGQRRTGGLKFKQERAQHRASVDDGRSNKTAGSDSVSNSSASADDTRHDKEANDTPQETPETPEEAAATEALNALTPQQGIDRLADLLATLDNLENASRLYSTLGTLYAQTGEPGAAPAEEAFAAAKTFARSHEDRHSIALAHVTALSARGDVEGAVREAAGALEQGDPYTLSGIQLAVTQGTLYEQQNALDQAEAAYKKAMQDALAAEPVLRDDALNVYRQACLSLVQLYRRTGREPAANSLVLTMKNKLASFE